MFLYYGFLLHFNIIISVKCEMFTGDDGVRYGTNFFNICEIQNEIQVGQKNYTTFDIHCTPCAINLYTDEHFA